MIFGITLQQNDIMMYQWIISNGYRPVIIATKMDKLKRSQIDKHIKEIKIGLGMEKDDLLIPVSSETKQNINKIWEYIESLNTL